MQLSTRDERKGEGERGGEEGREGDCLLEAFSEIDIGYFREKGKRQTLKS